MKKGDFFACYLLTSLSPRHKGHTYIGFTVNPRRRIRQHNGELRSGAWKTKSKRPWEMVLCIYGFPTNISALQFEWAWQHPFESLAVRKAAATLKPLGGLAGKIKLVYTMLTLPSWQSLPLTVNFFSTKYTKHSAGCPGLPEHTKVQVSSMEDLPCYTKAGLSTNEDEKDDCDYDQEINTTSSDDATMEGVIDMTVDSDGNPWKSVEDTNESHEMPPSSSSPNESDTLEEIGETNLSQLYQPAVIDMTVDSDGNPWKSVEDTNESREMPSSSSSTSPNESDDTLEEIGLFQLYQPAAADLQKSMHVDVSCDQAPTVGRINVGEADEVIDLLTPSPAYRIKSNRNMRKFSADCPKIIDLTSSPIFV